MTALNLLAHEHTATALALAQQWCRGHLVGRVPALGHALAVARTLVQHVPDAGADLIAAAVLHDAPYFAPDATVDSVLAERLSPRVAHIIRALADEHGDLSADSLPALVSDTPALLVSTADKIVSLQAIVMRDRAPSSGFLAALPYFRAFQRAAAPHLPPAMATELTRLVGRADRTDGGADA